MATGSFARSDFRNVEMEVVIRQRIRRPWRVRKSGPFGPQQRKPNKLDAAYRFAGTLPGRPRTSQLSRGAVGNQPVPPCYDLLARSIPAAPAALGLETTLGRRAFSTSTFTKIATVRPSRAMGALQPR